MRSAVLFLVFNRPDTTQQVFEAIRAARPPRLYVAADGPRLYKEGESEKCQQVRDIATAVDWPCEVKTLFREQNLGCKMGVSGGISWFFEHEEEGIILEDDVLPVPGFFRFCDELLEKYRHDPRVAMVSGNNNIAPATAQQKDSYFFTVHNLIWGWATWRRSWQHYDVTMRDWPQWRDAGGLEKTCGYGPFIVYWSNIFDKSHAGLIDTWDYQWAYTCWKLGGLTALSRNNLTDNLGFRPDATHTAYAVPDYIRLSPPADLEFPLRHPATLAVQPELEALIQQNRFLVPRHWRLMRLVQRVGFLKQIHQWLRQR